MFQDKYFVSKMSGSYAEALELFGLATLIKEIFQRNHIPVKVTLKNNSDHYSIILNAPITKEMIEGLDYFHTFPYITTKKREGNLEELGSAVIDYQREKAIKDAYNKAFKKAKAVEEKQNLEQQKPHQDYDIFSQIKGLGAIKAYNAIFDDLHNNKQEFQTFIQTVLLLYSNRNIDQIIVQKKLKKYGKLRLSRATQLFNPFLGKGVNRDKANKVTPSNVDVLGLREWMKFIGCYRSLYSRFIKVGDRSYDVKIFVLSPEEIDFDYYMAIYDRFRPSIRGKTSILLDIFSILKYLQTFITHLKIDNEETQSHRRRNPRTFVEGFYTTYLKDLGQGKAIVNASFLELPSFFPISTGKEKKVILRILEEHENILGGIKEDSTGAHTLMLKKYRKFLSTSSLGSLFDFLLDYNAFLMKEIVKKHSFIKPFTSVLMEELIMVANKKYAPILKNEGFRNIAKAIRNSTIREQYAKARNQQRFEIRYGMAQDIKRKAAYPEDLIQYFSDFIASYNSETARYAEQHPELLRDGKIRATVKTEDVGELVNLIDEFGSLTVGKLLSAFGYALERGHWQEGKSPSQNSNEGE